MTLSTISTKSEYGPDVQAEVRRLCAEDKIAEALAALGAHEPRDRSQQIDFSYISGYLQIVLGNYRGARKHLIHALRLTSRNRERRAYVRTKLAGLLYRTGEIAAAERQFHRALAEVHTSGLGKQQIPWLLGGLSVFPINRGRLSEAVRLLEQALSLGDASDQALRFHLSINIVLPLIELGDLARAEALFASLFEEPRPERPDWRWAHIQLAYAVYGLRSGRLDVTERALAEAEGSGGEFNLRVRVLVRQYRGELMLARGKAAEALPELESLLTDILQDAPHGDHVPMAARLVAEALLALGRHEAALAKAMMGVRAARHADMVEWSAGMRIAAEAQAALGRRVEARETFARVHEVLDVTEYIHEKAKLAAAMRRTGIDLGEPTREDTASPAGQLESYTVGPRSISLRDGRAFVTFDEELESRIAVAAAGRLPILIEGETGTGKELVVHLIHERGTRANRPLVVVDCSTLPEGLIEAELFGSVRGAFTGASADRAGLLASADGGTLFLDELPELPLATQAKLLRVLQDGSYRRVGEDRTRRVDVRVVAATNRVVEKLVMDGMFKPDLFFRLNGHRIQLPPLRESPRLVRHLAVSIARSEGVAEVAEDALDKLVDYGWPGNVRQLEMVVRVASATSRARGRLEAVSLVLPRLEGSLSSDARLRETRLHAERDRIEDVLQRHGGNVTAAARALSMSRQGLYKAMRRAGLRPPPETTES